MATTSALLAARHAALEAFRRDPTQGNVAKGPVSTSKAIGYLQFYSSLFSYPRTAIGVRKTVLGGIAHACQVVDGKWYLLICQKVRRNSWMMYSYFLLND